jgi:peptidyl-prolyl cis-trans isomerase B (cyclophilin B)
MMLAFTPVLTSLILGASALGAPAVGDAKVNWNAPTRFVSGLSFPVHIRIEAPDDGAAIANWLLTPGAFLLNGRPVMDREGGDIVELAPGSVLTLDFDLGPAIEASSVFKGKDFELGFAKEYLETEPISVRVFERVPAEVDLMTLSIEELTRCQVIVVTNRGNMVFELRPDKAPRHVRNFLDLCSSGFYDGTLFHRVGPTFMIQGGDPNTKTPNPATWGQGSGPRQLEAEFNDLKHERGVLSMARSTDPNSASCQFFVMTSRAPFLDGSYSAFGRLISGEETLDRIATARGAVRIDQSSVRPAEPQRILSTTVVRAASTDDESDN